VKTGAAGGKPPRPDKSGETVTAGFPKSCHVMGKPLVGTYKAILNPSKKAC